MAEGLSAAEYATFRLCLSSASWWWWLCIQPKDKWAIAIAWLSDGMGIDGAKRDLMCN